MAEDLAATLREALSNVARHAQARRVDMWSWSDGGGGAGDDAEAAGAGLELSLMVADDGTGPPADAVHGGHGLRNLATRAAAHGGTAALAARDAGGALLTWRAPPIGPSPQVTFGPARRWGRTARWRAVEGDIEASTTIQIPIEQATEVLVDDLRRILADLERRPARRRARRPGPGDGHADGEWADHVTSTLVVGLGAGGSVSIEVEVEVGNASRGDGVTTVPLHWTPAGATACSPASTWRPRGQRRGAGRLAADGAGHLHRALGSVGRFGDGVIGRRLGRQSLASFVEGVARRLDGEAHRRAAAVSWHPALYPVTVI